MNESWRQLITLSCKDYDVYNLCIYYLTNPDLPLGYLITRFLSYNGNILLVIGPVNLPINLCRLVPWFKEMEKSEQDDLVQVCCQLGWSHKYAELLWTAKMPVDHDIDLSETMGHLSKDRQKSSRQKETHVRSMILNLRLDHNAPCHCSLRSCKTLQDFDTLIRGLMRSSVTRQQLPSYVSLN